MSYFRILSMATANSEALAAFMGGDGLARALDAIVQTHVIAAELAVADLEGAANPRSLVEEARGHIRVAYVATMKVLEPQSLGIKIFNLTPFSFETRLSAAVIAWKLSSLMAVCHCYLGERELLEKYLRQANDDLLRLGAMGRGDYRWGRLVGDLGWKRGELTKAHPTPHEFEEYDELVGNLRKLGASPPRDP